MKLSIYLHRYVIDTLKTFGNLNDVINKILQEGDDNKFDITGKPPCPSREGAARIEVNITNDAYLDMLYTYGVKSKTISLRRLLYWFVDYEVYDTLDWTPVNDYIDENDARINRLIDDITSKIDKLILYTKNTGDLTHAKDLIINQRR